jgi:hypothetical protein
VQAQVCVDPKQGYTFEKKQQKQNGSEGRRESSIAFDTTGDYRFMFAGAAGRPWHCFPFAKIVFETV